MGAQLLESNLSAFFETLLSLHSESPPADFDSLGTYLSENVTAYTISMREHFAPRRGRADAIQGFKEIIEKSRTVERRIVSQVVDVLNRTIFCEMRNKLLVAGVELDPFHETDVVRFDEQGKIKDFKRYCCLSPVAAINQKVRGIGGMYAKVDAMIDELHLREPVNAANCCD